MESDFWKAHQLLFNAPRPPLCQANMLFFNSVLILALASSVLGGWITFSNENKAKEGLPCVGRLFGNDNYLVSEFDCGATDFNSTFCGIHCFPYLSLIHI